MGAHFSGRPIEGGYITIGWPQYGSLLMLKRY